MAIFIRMPTACAGPGNFPADDVLLHALPVFHIHGLFVATNVSLLSGASMLLLPKFEPDAVFQALPQATVMMGVPTFYTRLLKDSRLAADSTRHMRAVHFRIGAAFAGNPQCNGGSGPVTRSWNAMA